MKTMNAPAFLLANEDAATEERTRAIGRELYARMRQHEVPAWRRPRERLLARVMRDAELQARLFRLVDVLPSLDSAAATIEMLGDAVTSDRQADAYADTYLSTPWARSPRPPYEAR